MCTHMRRHNPEKLFKCMQCNYEGNQRGILNSHIRSKHDNLWYHCEFCEYKASQKGNLKTHVQHKHEGVVLCHNTTPPQYYYGIAVKYVISKPVKRQISTDMCNSSMKDQYFNFGNTKNRIMRKSNMIASSVIKKQPIEVC